MVCRRFAALIAVCALVGMTAAAAIAQPVWQLDFKQHGLERIRVSSGSRHTVQYYMIYSVTNSSDQERPFNINLRLMTDTKKTGRDLGNIKVAKAIKARTKKPKLLSRSEQPRTISPGTTFECVAVFGRIDPHADEIWIDATGLRDVVVTRNGQDFYEKAARRMIFSRPGDSVGADRDRVKLKKSAWVVLSGPDPVR